MSDDRGQRPVAGTSTPIQLCGAAVARLSEQWDEMIPDRTGARQGKFIEEIFGGVWRDGDTGEKFEDEIDRWHEQPEEVRPFGIIQAMLVSCGYACQGMRAQNAGDLGAAWEYTARCQYWLGIAVGSWSVRNDKNNDAGKRVGSNFAAAGALARHRENHEMRKQVLEWWEKNKNTCQSKDGAAQALAGKVVPAKYRTVRDWLKGA